MGEVKKRFKSEERFAAYTIPLILGGMIPTKYKALAEVPRSSHNNHADLLVIQPGRKVMRFVEFKLRGGKDLQRQVNRTRHATGIHTMGILNQVQDRVYSTREQRDGPIVGLRTFSDAETDRLIQTVNNPYRWTSIYDSGFAMMLWYASLSMDSNYAGAGARDVKRESLYVWFRRAVRNLNYTLEGHATLDVVAMMFKGVYSLSSVRRHRKIALADETE